MDVQSWLASSRAHLADGLLESSETSEDMLKSFIAQVWEHTPLHLPGADPAGFAQLLQLEDIDTLMCRGALPDMKSEILLFEAQRQIDHYSSPHAAFAAGASIVCR